MKIFSLKNTIAALLVSVVSLNTVWAQDKGKNALPEIGVVASEVLTLEKESIIGDAIMRQMRGQAPLIQDPLLDEYLQDIGNRLVANADNVKFPFSFFWINNDAINAFAFYGGHIGVHSGLIHNAESESQLASVLSHEIAHVTQRHLARKTLAQQRATPLQIASMLGGIFLAIANPEAGMAAISTTQAASSQMQIDYTRSNEQEADRIGIDVLARSGYDPNAAASFFGILAAQYRMVSRPPARLLSHPLTEARIADARSRARGYSQVTVPPSLSFHLAKARIMARYTFDEDYAFDYYTAALDKNKYVFKQAAQYGLAIALLRKNEAAKAKPIIDELLEADPNNLFYLDVATDTYLALGKTKQAIALLMPHFEFTPRNGVLAMNLSNALIKDEQYDRAIQILRDYLLVNEGDEIAYQMLIEAYQDSRQLKDMHQTKAELFALYGAYRRAIDELQFAYNFSGDNHLVKQRIRARIKQFRDEEDKLKRL